VVTALETNTGLEPAPFFHSGSVLGSVSSRQLRMMSNHSDACSSVVCRWSLAAQSSLSLPSLWSILHSHSCSDLCSVSVVVSSWGRSGLCA